MSAQTIFEYHLQQVSTLLEKAAKQKNPALWLYRNNGRTPFFMLEGLAKLHAGIHNKKKFSKLKEQFKLVEDAIGAIDYYDAFAKSFAANKKIPKNITAYLQAQTREKLQSLNELLEEKGWLDGGRLKKTRKKLDEADWLKPVDEVKAIQDFYGEAIYGIAAFVQTDNFHFDNVEADVHELRRKLRWLSIYPQAFRGLVQLDTSRDAPKNIKKYLTKEVTTSPFNVMPDAGDNRYFLLLDRNYFYALSWIIAELGKLKDSGLGIIAIREALQQQGTVDDKKAYAEARKMLGAKQPSIESILTNAAGICKTFFEDHVLEYLVLGTAGMKE